MDQGTRSELISRLADAIRSVRTAHPLRVAIDVPPASGRTTLADELAVILRAQDRDVIRATIDDFLFPRAQRYRRGQYSAEGCYFDALDRAALCRVLLFDGVFLLRPKLVDRWDLRIFVSVPFEQTVDRARDRDSAAAGSIADASEIERS
ncbi:hypothetical protein AB0E78_22955 [Streptomyces sp. NPDC032198]|uniref:hypothetical protein n=1 Tax=Streptomyces sp. NPDC032198 TaxID=3155127 RepID=UPI0033FD1E99